MKNNIHVFGGLIGAAVLLCGMAVPAQADTVASAKVVDATASIEAVAINLYNELQAASNPEEAYSAFTGEERAAFDAYFLPAETRESFTLTQLGADGEPVGAAKTFESESDAMESVVGTQACWVGTSKYTAFSGVGNAIWDTWTEGRWCGSGGKVTSASISGSWSTIAALGWRDGGKVGSGSGISGNTARMWSQRKMILGAGGWDIQEQRPCNRLNGSASGGTSATWRCSIG